MTMPWRTRGAYSTIRPRCGWAPGAVRARRRTMNQSALRDSGYFIMRSGWDRDARYLFFEGGPYGRWHQHEDKLSFEVYAYGTPPLSWIPASRRTTPTPGPGSIRPRRPTIPSLWTARPQARGRNQTIEQWTRSARDSTFWHSDFDSDVAAASYDAPYADLDAAVRHRRAVIFVKPDYFMVFDELTGEGSHMYEALFHFMPFRLLIRFRNRRRPHRAYGCTQPGIDSTDPDDAPGGLRPKRPGPGLAGG